jgi:hypothetical protein
MNQQFVISVQRSHSEPTKDGKGTMCVPDPPVWEKVSVIVDLEGIAKRYGPIACRAKGRKSKQMHGLVKIAKVNP